MGLPSILLVLGILAVIAISVPSVSGQVSGLFGNKKTEAQKNKEEQEQMKREEKGAIKNTSDFLFGEGTFDKVFSSKGSSRNGGQQVKKTIVSAKSLDTELKSKTDFKLVNGKIVDSQGNPTNTKGLLQSLSTLPIKKTQAEKDQSTRRNRRFG